MKIHFIAIGGSVMHHLAIALRLKGYNVTGSDDEIYEPAASNLKKYGLMPEKEGWHPEKISADIDGIILGMHARADNPELMKAQELNIPVYSYPEYIYEQSKNKQRVVIGGSHGKTTITSMIMFVLNRLNKDFDYLVGAKIEGFERMVNITESAPVVVLEGDEYLASALNRKPKFLFYNPHITVLSGIAWDHINAFPTFEEYRQQFEKYLHTITPEGILFYYEADPILKKVVEESTANIKKVPYETPEFHIENGITHIKKGHKTYKLKVFGKHNLSNLKAAMNVCKELGVEEEQFLEEIQGFTGAAKRLEKLAESEDTVVYKDFAHSPSKVKATIAAVKEQYQKRSLVACLELHTFSSLNRDFIKEYKGTMDEADEKIIFLNEHAMKMKRMELSKNDIWSAFENKDILIFEQEEKLLEYLKSKMWKNKNLLLMSSGTFGKADLNDLANFVAIN